MILAKEPTQNCKLNNYRILFLHLLILFPIIYIFWTNDFVSYGDNFEHLARMFILLNYDHLDFLQKYYYLDVEVTPYLALDIFFYLLKDNLSIYEIGKLLSIFYLVFVIGGALFINYQIFKKFTPHTLFAYAFVFNVTFANGLVNFYIAICFILWGFGLWLMLNERRFKRFVIFFLFTILLYFVHLFGLAIFLLVVGIYEVQSNCFEVLKKPKLLLHNAMQFAAFLIVPMFLLSKTSAQDMGTEKILIAHYAWDELHSVFFSPVSYNMSFLTLGFYLLFLSLIIIGVWKLSKNIWLVLILAVIAIFVPKVIYQMWFMNFRLPTIILLLITAMVSFSTKSEKLFGKLLFAFTCALYPLVLFQDFSEVKNCNLMIAEYKLNFANIPEGSRVINVKTNSDQVLTCSFQGTFEHIGALGIIEHQLFVPELFTGLPPVKVEPKYEKIAAKLGGPISLEELNLNAEGLLEYKKILRRSKYAEYILQKLYWENWRQDFDYVIITHFGNINYEAPAELKEISQNSWFSTYKINKSPQ